MSTAELTVKGIKYTVNIGDKFNRLKIQETTNVYLNYNGEVHYITEWCRLLGINRSTVQNRLNKGWSVGKALGLE